MKLGLRSPVRSADSELLDTFLVSAVATLLIIRIYLEAAGYPQLGGEGWHIAHVLWGGFGMLVAILLLLLFLSSTTRLVAALIGGAGFGAFIDELGKFVTSDNDYFFKPTAAIVYVVFVVLFLAVRQIRRFRGLSQEESLVNAIELSEKLVMGHLSEVDRDHALELLARADQSDPMVAALRERFRATAPPAVRPSRLRRIGGATSAKYHSMASSTWFRRLIAGVFVLQGIGFLVSVFAAAAVLTGSLFGIASAQTALDEATGGSTLSSWIQLIAGLIAGAMIVVGIVALRRSRLNAFHAFELAVLVDLLLVQPFAFLDSGFVATLDVLLDLGLLAVLRYLELQERRLAVSNAAAVATGAARVAG
ncbi:MAG: hypothetical protein AUH85_07245 [Chloroflexi bacterium 13_1_40CM_4_68_4]|nr:MAG: hypothetical protein AUH85_07245 [Chloroflexi bacterium 13_1_40CM_4_68_4]